MTGHADAFTGKTFVFSGVLPSLFRDAAKDLVLSHGGRVTGTARPQPSSSRAQQPACARSDALLFVQLHCRCSCCG